MSSTPHPVTAEEIMAHLDGELAPARAESLTAHIETCAACQDMLTSMRATSQALSSWTIPTAPANPKLMEQLSSASIEASRGLNGAGGVRHSIFPRRHWKLLTASGVLATLLLMMIGFSESRFAAPSPFSRAREKEAMKAAVAAREQQDDGSRLDLSASGALPEEKAMVTAGDRFESAEASKTPADKATREFQKLQLYSKIARPGESGQAGPMIARTVSLAIITKDFDSSRASLDAILARQNGYSATLSVSTPQDAARSLQASLRIPAPQLAAALVELKALGRVELENQNGEEVTQQHADLLARLKNSRETEQRLQAILTQRTGKISDVLEVEQEIARVRGEIEQMEAEQKNLEHRVDFATIDLKLSEEYKAKLDFPAPAISTLIHNAAVNGYRNVSDTLLSIVLFFAEYGPVLCFWLSVFFIPGWLVWRRWRHATATI
jgi:anti-sigma factor RsiW